MRLARYSPTAEYVAGKYMVVADTLSRDVMGDGIYSEVEAKLAREINEYSVQAIDSLPVSEPKLQQIIEQQELDNIIVGVKSYTRNGWPEGVDGELNYYWKERSYLGLIDDLLVFNDRIVIPSSMRREVMKKIHDDGNLSLSKCRIRAQNAVWWPEISEELSRFIEHCSFCQENRRKNLCEPLKPTKLPERPWQRVVLDIFE